MYNAQKVEDTGKSESLSVMLRIGIQNLSHLKEGRLPVRIDYMKDKESMNASSSTTRKWGQCRRMKKMKWSQIDWNQAEEYVNRLQIRIVKATLENKWRLIKRLQYLFTHSFYAKAIAIKRVVTNKGKNTPGIDGVLWKNDGDKTTAIQKLDVSSYHANPLKRIYIEKFGKKEKRLLGIPNMKDRAMQALQLLALEPVAETTADRISFGFRRYRSPVEAREYGFRILSWKRSPQGGIISPTYANMTLDGMEPMILAKYWANKKGIINVRHNSQKVHVVRFADDFVVTANSREVLEDIKDMIIEFLGQRGLELSVEKTVITHINDGFDFLGGNFRKFNEKLIIKPSSKSINKVTQTISELIHNSRTVLQEQLIYRINEVTRGWANYHHSVCSKKAFALMDYRIWEMVL
jgi:RNA-directed DNA polymerase